MRPPESSEFGKFSRVALAIYPLARRPRRVRPRFLRPLFSLPDVFFPVAWNEPLHMKRIGSPHADQKERQWMRVRQPGVLSIASWMRPPLVS